MAPGLSLEQHRRALRYHCYQMLGSLTDADDLVQETMSRALTSADSFQGRAEVRTWLFRIATNACIDELRRRKRRKLVSTSRPNGSELEPIEEADLDEWVQPFPDALVPDRLARSEAVTLAFIAALQWLAPRQRAVLVLRDSLAWSAEEVAELLGMTTTAVHSALIRARERIKAKGAGGHLVSPGRAELAVARRFATAFARNDLDTITTLLRADVSIHMPPLKLWLHGRAKVTDFFARRMWPDHTYTASLTRANGLPAVAMSADGSPFAVIAFELDRAHRIKTLHGFLIPALVSHFAG